MSNYSIGHIAEKYASKHLSNIGFKVLTLNWKTQWCEIDIIASKNNIIYFFEVKYRKNDFQGSGFDYITNLKISKMQKAAEGWVLLNKYNGEYQLGAIEMTGNNFQISNVLLDI